MAQDVWVNIETLRGEVTETSYTMLAAGKAIAKGLGGSLRAVLLGNNVKGLAGKLGAADSVTVVDHPALADFNPEAHLLALADLAKKGAPRAFLFGQTASGTDLACGLAAKLGFPVASPCRTFKVEGGEILFEAVTCGGKIIAEGKLPGPTGVAIVMPGGYKPEEAMQGGSPKVDEASPESDLGAARTRFRAYIEPDTSDVDISKVPILVSVGRGIGQKENIEAAKELAAALGGEVSSSRPIVDQGWLPTSRLVGKSGKAVKPKLYLALGISGSPEHMEGLPGWETLVAINTDQKAPIYDVATYGAAVDVLELVPKLTEKVRATKS
ncbi:MAG: electron transfer flavoprotein subunit alpha/FixB family protein [Candidatus Eisenbacteria bacterium]|nr:electron transfer flavoprotein subunit alpha/FixB family protein [Candidatus Eisenbacteria bacterium]